MPDATFFTPSSTRLSYKWFVPSLVRQKKKKKCVLGFSSEKTMCGRSA